jgi:hypothetical protein
LNALNPNHVEELAAALGTKPGLIEKDWHVVRAIGVLASLDLADATPVFSGGTSLSKGWGIIKRFSEDIDFKVMPPAATSAAANRNQRRAFRKRILSALTSNEFGREGLEEALGAVKVVRNRGEKLHFTAYKQKGPQQVAETLSKN